MIFEKIEHNSVNLHYKYEVDDETLIEVFGSVSRFEELLAYHCDYTGASGVGDNPATPEEEELFIDFCCELDPTESEEDWWSARKGGYEVSWSEIDDT